MSGGPSQDTATTQGDPAVGKRQPPTAGSSLPQALCHTGYTCSHFTSSNPSTEENHRLGTVRQQLAHSRQGRIPTPAPWPRKWGYQPWGEGLALQERGGATESRRRQAGRGLPTSRELAGMQGRCLWPEVDTSM